jgi:DNA-binding MarR family transcriptional regulator
LPRRSFAVTIRFRPEKRAVPDDQSSSSHPVRPHLGAGDEGGRLSRRLAHIGLQQLVRLIRRGSGLAYSRMSGLSDFEWRVLARVCDAPGHSINELGSIMDRGVPQVSRTVKRLVELGLLERRRLGGGPGVAITPTPAGEATYAPLVEVAVMSERELTSGLTAAELKTLDRIIAVMSRNALERIAREQQLQAPASARTGAG